MFKKFSAAVVLTLALTLGFGTMAMAKTYINGIDANYPPFAYVDAAGNPAGFDVEAAEWIAKKMGFEVKHVPTEWSGIVASLVAKKIDFVASGMSITAEREEVISFTNPYWKVAQVLVAKKGTSLKPENILKDGMKLGVQSGTTEAEWLEKNKEKTGANYTLRFYDSAPMAIQDVVNGRIDAAAMDSAPAHDAEGKKPVIIIGGFGLDPENFGYGVRKEDKELREMLNKGLALLMADPFWDVLIKKYNPGAH
ncbi:MAG: ABC transporter substrate-binding protein [Desulfovibrio sp.]